MKIKFGSKYLLSEKKSCSTYVASYKEGVLYRCHCQVIMVICVFSCTLVLLCGKN